jgi:hypothetical protein
MTVSVQHETIVVPEGWWLEAEESPPAAEVEPQRVGASPLDPSLFEWVKGRKI